MQVRDPVCGKLIHLADTVASEDDAGWAYFFCSRFCHNCFKAAPARYTGERPLRRGNTETGAGEGAGGSR